MMAPLRVGLPFSDDALSLISLMLWLGLRGLLWLPLLRCRNLTSRCALAIRAFVLLSASVSSSYLTFALPKVCIGIAACSWAELVGVWSSDACLLAEPWVSGQRGGRRGGATVLLPTERKGRRQRKRREAMRRTEMALQFIRELLGVDLWWKKLSSKPCVALPSLACAAQNGQYVNGP